MTSEIASSAPAHAAIEVNSRARFEILGAIMLALFLGALDQTIVGPVLPKISTELNGASLYVWVVTSYLVTSTAAIPIYGKLSDYFGRKPMLIIGIVLFLIGSVLSGLSQTMIAAGHLPRRSGPRRRRPLPDLAGGHRRPVHPGRARQVPGPLRRRLRHRLPGRPVPRRRPDGQPLLALDLLRQRAGRARLALPDRPAAADGPPAGSPSSARLSSASLTFIGAVVPVLIALTLAETSSWVDPYRPRPGSPSASSSWSPSSWSRRRAKDPMIPLDLFRNRTFAVSVSRPSSPCSASRS